MRRVSGRRGWLKVHRSFFFLVSFRLQGATLQTLSIYKPSVTGWKAASLSAVRCGDNGNAVLVIDSGQGHYNETESDHRENFIIIYFETIINQKIKRTVQVKKSSDSELNFKVNQI